MSAFWLSLCLTALGPQADLPPGPDGIGQHGPEAQGLPCAGAFCTLLPTEVAFTKMACLALAPFTHTLLLPNHAQ